MDILPVGAEMFHTDGCDGNYRLSVFCKRSYKSGYKTNGTERRDPLYINIA